MSRLLLKSPYEERDESLFLEEMNALARHHLKGCEPFSRIWPHWEKASTAEALPFLHVGLFKHLELKTGGDDIKHKRMVLSSSTTGPASRIALDEKSSLLQADSSRKILIDFLGEEKRPLLILDSAKSIRRRGELSARVAAAMSLQPLASEIHFLLEDPDDAGSLKSDVLRELLEANDDILVYGFSWILWLAWAAADFSSEIKKALKGKTIHFVHSGGWKRLESIKISNHEFNKALLQKLDPASGVTDYYGLVEQIGIIYPLCNHGARHVPVWGDVIVRDPYSYGAVTNEVGQLQLLNTLACGAPYFNVLTEDLGQILPGQCPCGRKGKRFSLRGRIPRAEIRGCANV